MASAKERTREVWHDRLVTAERVLLVLCVLFTAAMIAYGLIAKGSPL